MKMASIQPHRLVEELQRADVPEEIAGQGQPVKTGLVAVLFSGRKRPRVGIPHGAKGVCVWARNVYINPKTREVAYCHSRDYRAQSAVAQGDGQPYPEAVETDVSCEVAKEGAYDVCMKVSVNGSVAVEIFEAVPCTA